MSADSRLTVDEARRRILERVPRAPDEEIVPLSEAAGRTLARDVASRRTQPPFAVSAMDGYAVRAGDLAALPVRLRVVGESAAGHGFAGDVGAGEAVRIFTGAPVPRGADAILIQEEARLVDGHVEPTAGVSPGLFVRRRGLDFAEGEALLSTGTRLTPAALALAAAMDHASLPVARRPRVGLFATGDELVPPGGTGGADKIVASNLYAIAALVEWGGGAVVNLGLVGDDLAAIENAVARARAFDCDVLTTSGGASVGDHDLVRPALERAGMTLDFWRIRLRPGAPMLHGSLGRMSVLGLPGNPTSAVVCATLFLVPLVRALSGDPDASADAAEAAILGLPLKANDARQEFMRATLERRPDALPFAIPLPAQDSSMLSTLARAQCLIVRDAHAPEAKAGDPCRILRMPGW
ncbi:gephyrin-like molybdotransferase Glp [Methylocella sp.]|uniref:molybdopterin molybdotransferase MoeA n=1 Tax=Methylocella sp. TaxID=1978226 RepID=UPI00378324D4